MPRQTSAASERIHHGLVLAAWVRQRRMSLGLTQEQVAERMGDDVEPGWVTQLETGQKKLLPSQPRLGQLARALSVSELDLLHGSGLLADADDAPADPLTFPAGDPRHDILAALPGLTDRQASALRTMIQAFREGDAVE